MFLGDIWGEFPIYILCVVGSYWVAGCVSYWLFYLLEEFEAFLLKKPPLLAVLAS